MKVIKNILVYLNADGEPEPALETARQLARDQNAHLTLVSVVDDTGWRLAHALRPEWNFRETVLVERRRQLKLLEGGLVAEGLSASSEILIGRPSIEIIRQVVSGGHDLVVKTARPDLPEHGPSYGAIACRLVRMCPCPVWIVQPTVYSSRGILAAVDPAGSDEHFCYRILEMALAFSRWQNAALYVVHAWGGHPFPLAEEALSGAELLTFVLESRSDTEKRLRTLLERLPAMDPEANVHLIQGEAHRVIPAFVRQYDIDLVVMGTMARRGLAGLIIGNTAERLLRRLSCSLLAIKPDGFVSPVDKD